MASTVASTNPESADSTETVGLLICLPQLAGDALDLLLDHIAEAFPDQDVLVATPDRPAGSLQPRADGSPLRVTGYMPAAVSTVAWAFTAANFLSSHVLARQYGAQTILQLGEGAESLSINALRGLAGAIAEGQADLAMPRYDLPVRAGLINASILYPLTRALFGPRVRYPLALDLALSARGLERMAATAQRATAARQPDAILWPVIETVFAGFRIAEIDAGPRILPQAANLDQDALLALIASSLFAEIDRKAAYWQRSRVMAAARPFVHSPDPWLADTHDTQPMLQSFCSAYGKLHDVWSHVLPPQTLVGLKRLSAMPAATFSMSDAMWTRIVYDFLLAFRLRTLDRVPLLHAFTPLHQAWVASHILLTSQGTDPEAHIEAVATAFETDRPYFISRWRWPDRFNP